MKFKEHGSFKIEVIEQVIVVRLYGQWNIETVERFCAEAKLEMLKICDSPWAVLVDLLEWELGPPDMWGPLSDVNRWASQNNQVAEASVLDVELHRQVMSTSNQSFEGVETNVFEDFDNAFSWLKERVVFASDDGKLKKAK